MEMQIQVKMCGDYITITQIDGKNYLNISSYIGSNEINKSKTDNGVTITVCKEYIYMDYTVLSLKIKNTRNSAICIDTKENLDTTYIYDTNSVKYTSFLNEISKEQLQIRPNMEMDLNIKFNKMYNPSGRDLNGIILKDVVLNYEEYIQNLERKETVTFDIKV